MIKTIEDLKTCLKYEREVYSSYMFPTKVRFVLSRIKREPARMIYSFLRLSRKTDYYNLKKDSGTILHRLKYFIYVCRKNRLGEKLGIEIETLNVAPGLMIYHYNNVINGGSIIGKNCHLHGDNCIGNDGITKDCPVIGDNVSLGVGASIIGNVLIGNNIKIAAGAVVVHSFPDDNITIGGVPAKRIR